MTDRKMLWLALAVWLAGCASETGSTRARWVTTDGAPADPAAVEAAGALCEERVSGQLQSRERWDSLAWGVAIVECMEGEGFVRQSVRAE